ncbi:hypothetical protein ABFA07_013964 [Porites harrisoni]
MKSIITFVFVLTFLILNVGAGTKETAEHDFIYKAAAQICKPYFLRCKQNPEKGISDCFKDVYYRCLPTYRSWLQSVEQCASTAGEDFAAVLGCAKGSNLA